MKRLLLLIGSLSLLTTPVLLACSDDNAGTGDEGTPDSGTVERVDSGTPPDTDCTPMTVEEAIAARCGAGMIECGTAQVADGCGDLIAINCPPCAEDEACNASNICVAKGEESCVPAFTREEAIATYCGEGAGKTECGAITLADGCAGITIDCGGCDGDMACSNNGVCISQSCTPSITEEEARAATCGNGEGQIECGTRRVNNGCGVYEITCACGGELVCNTELNACVESCTPLNANTAYAYYCHHAPTYWECGGKIERDDLCGGKVMVNCGNSDKVCQNGTECDLDPASEQYLHCVDATCQPDPESRASLCTRYHSECGTVTGKVEGTTAAGTHCELIETATCPTCPTGEMCVGSIGGSSDSSYHQQTCEPLPATAPIEACAKVNGDTSASTATEVMMIEHNGGYLYTAPEVVYAYTATADRTVTISATPFNDQQCAEGKDGYDLVLYVVSALDSRAALKLSKEGGSCEGESVTLAVTSGTTYYVVVDGDDLASQRYDRGPFQIEIDDGSCEIPMAGKVVISALYAGGSAGESNAQCKPETQGASTLIGTAACEVFHQDYIELHNTGSEAIDISGWSVFVSPIDSNKNWQKKGQNTIREGTSIPAGGYYLIAERSPDDNANELGDDIQDIPKEDFNVGKGQFGLSTDKGHKILIAVKDVTADTLNKAKDASGNVVGTECPGEEQGILFVYGGASVCGSQLATPAANQLYHSSDGCAALSLTDFDVRADPATDEHNNTTHPITSISPIPRNSDSETNTCQ